jgi:hypothetical protein
MVAFLFFCGFAFMALWLITFPIRLVFRLVFGLGGILLRFLFAPILMLVVGVAILVAFVAAVIALVTPLLPLAALAALGWVVYRVATSRRAMPI